MYSGEDPNWGKASADNDVASPQAFTVISLPLLSGGHFQHSLIYGLELPCSHSSPVTYVCLNSRLMRKEMRD